MAPRKRGKELDPQLRARIRELKSIGWSYRRIQNKYSDIPLSTIKSTILRDSLRLNNVSIPRPGRPKKLTEEQRDRIYESAMSNPHIKLPALIDEVDGAVQKRTIQRLLHEKGCSWKQMQLNPSEKKLDNTDKS